ncbi:hypothetical protein [Altibacter sp. HG106]|uniref:hypothetical protein n=1 Tax=Altibacter sp. HG106 TaxID=3023937 RepID=UPI002350CD66|nr:hypothetical protein [Altibacter sp. HG106]MDC7995033.1 hypothetical protein [Altibacter sp. HG106]
MWRSLLISVGACILLWSASNCGATTNSESEPFVTNPEFSISDAYVQDWTAGIPEGGSGTNLFVSFATLSEDIRLQKFHYNGLVTAAKKVSDNGDFAGYFIKEGRGDVQMSSDPEVEAANTPPVRSTLDIKDGVAVIEFQQNGVTKYFEVISIRIAPMISYPSTPPTEDQ